jgi:predicted nuclease of restriction endonuclease-like (RecB) superfamily
MSDSITASAEYNELLASIKRTIAAGRLRAARAVNSVMIETYWQIGQDIVGRRREQATTASRWPDAIGQQSAAQLPWDHVMVILDSCADQTTSELDPVRERDLSKALTDNLSRFLRELGTGFAFVGAEVPIQCGDREFFLDFLFYHCRV